LNDYDEPVWCPNHLIIAILGVPLWEGQFACGQFLLAS